MEPGWTWTRPGVNQEPAAEAGGGSQACALTTAPEMHLRSVARRGQGGRRERHGVPVITCCRIAEDAWRAAGVN